MTYNRNNPFPAPLISRRRLSGVASDKNVQHLVFDISGSGMTYKCGDSVAILPKNSIIDVAQVLQLLKVQPDIEVTLPNSEIKLPIFFALQSHLCITHLSRGFLEWFSGNITASDEYSYIEDKLLCADDECKLLSKSYSLYELLNKFKSWRRLDIHELVTNLKRLTPRLYSIASSPSVYPNEIHVVVNVVDYINLLGNTRRGIASNYLVNDLNIGYDTVNMFIVTSMFALPDDHLADIILIGPGTGIAPFRGFLQERQFTRDNGNEIGKTWLFFGDRHLAEDFLFNDELVGFEESGVLNRLHVAFSRDQQEKIYVQDRIWENRHEVWSWILNGAYIYVCGDATRMANDVQMMLTRIAIEVGEHTENSADEFLKNLKKCRRYQRDVY